MSYAFLILFASAGYLPASVIFTSTSCSSFGPQGTIPIKEGGGLGSPHAQCSISVFDRGSFRNNFGTADVRETAGLAETSVAVSLYRFAPANVLAEATWSQTFDVTFFGGTGELLVQPCMNVVAPLGNEAVATFGDVTLGVAGGARSLCGNGQLDRPLSFPGQIFGQTYRMNAALSAKVGNFPATPDSGARAQFLYSFEGWTSTPRPEGGFQLIPVNNLTWTLAAVDIPEPATFGPATLLLALGLTRRRLR